MNILDFSTQINQSGNQNGVSAGKAPGMAAVQFLDMLLGQVSVEEIQTSEGKTLTLKSDPSLADKGDEVLQEKGDLNLLQLALLGQEANTNIDEKLAELRVERLDNRVNQLTKLIDHLTNGLPANVDQSGSLEALVSRLQERLENLETKIDMMRDGEGLSDPNSAFPLLIATGLNPNQMTGITQRINEVENKLGRPLTVEDLIAGVANIIPAPGTDEADGFSVGDTLELANKYAGDSEAEKLIAMAENTVLTDELAEQLNNLQTGGTQDNGLTSDDLQKMAGLVNSALNKQLSGEEITPGALPEEQIVQTLRSNAELQELRNTIKNKNNNNGIVKANLEALSDNAAPITGGFSGDIFLPESWSTLFTDMFEAFGIDIDSGIPLTPSMQAIHSTTAITHAGQPHAATQMVATQMTKAAEKGAAQEMTIQLDPPELGRVEIKLEFGPEKTIKASLVVEKPETYLLLQRDVAALEKALENAGLDAGSSDLNFELADSGYDFDGDKRGQGQESAGNRANELNEEIIETTMSWEFDPETGHTHYSILA